MANHKLIILRHGESEWNHLNRFCGWIDVSLTEKGRKEARFAGDLIRDHGLKPMKMYTSKLKRSVQTGNLILEELDREWCDVVKTWRLNERHYGSFQGRDKNEVYKELGPKEFQFIRRDYNGLPPEASDGLEPWIDDRYDAIDIDKDGLPRAESLKMVMERLIPYIEEEVLRKDLVRDNKTVLIVTHGSVCRSLIKYFNNVSDDDISSINVPTGVPIVFELDDNLKQATKYYYLDHELAMQRIAKVRDEDLPSKKLYQIEESVKPEFTQSAYSELDNNMAVLVYPPFKNSASEMLEEDLYHLPNSSVQGMNALDSPAPALYRSPSNTVSSSQNNAVFQQPSRINSLFGSQESFNDQVNRYSNGMIGKANSPAEYKQDIFPMLDSQLQTYGSVNPFTDYGNPDSLNSQLQNHSFIDPVELTHRRRRITTLNTDETMHNKPLKDEEQVLFNPEISPSHFVSSHDFWSDGGVYTDSMYVANEAENFQPYILDNEAAFIDELDEEVEEELSDDDDDNYFCDDDEFDRMLDEREEIDYIDHNENENFNHYLPGSAMSGGYLDTTSQASAPHQHFSVDSELQSYDSNLDLHSGDLTSSESDIYMDLAEDTSAAEHTELRDDEDFDNSRLAKSKALANLSNTRTTKTPSGNQNTKPAVHLSVSEVSASNPNHICDLVNPSTGQLCNKQFSRPYDLIRHQETIHASKKKIFRCVICEGRLNGGPGNGKQKTFSRGDALSRHIKVKHGLVGHEAMNIINEAKANVEYIQV